LKENLALTTERDSLKTQLSDASTKLKTATDSILARDEAEAKTLTANILKMAGDSMKEEELKGKSLEYLRASFDSFSRIVPKMGQEIPNVLNGQSKGPMGADSKLDLRWNPVK